jgi:hypothetical protein
MKTQVVVFWIGTLCSHVVGYLRFGGPCCLHLQGESGGSMVLHDVSTRKTTSP